MHIRISVFDEIRKGTGFLAFSFPPLRKANYQKPVYLGTCKKAVNGSGCDINENINISLERE
jgi:hypothetical protein